MENDPQWRREWVDAEAASEGPVREGDTTALFAHVLGRRIKTVYEVAVYEPSRFTESRTVSGLLPLTFRRAFEAVWTGVGGSTGNLSVTVSERPDHPFDRGCDTRATPA